MTEYNVEYRLKELEKSVTILEAGINSCYKKLNDLVQDLNKMKEGNFDEKI